MIALDTNVLVRLVTRDNEAQARRAREAFDTHGEEHGGLFVPDIVLAELCAPRWPALKPPLRTSRIV